MNSRVAPMRKSASKEICLHGQLHQQKSESYFAPSDKKSVYGGYLRTNNNDQRGDAQVIDRQDNNENLRLVKEH